MMDPRHLRTVPHKGDARVLATWDKNGEEVAVRFARFVEAARLADELAAACGTEPDGTFVVLDDEGFFLIGVAP